MSSFNPLKASRDELLVHMQKLNKVITKQKDELGKWKEINVRLRDENEKLSRTCLDQQEELQLTRTMTAELQDHLRNSDKEALRLKLENERLEKLLQSNNVSEMEQVMQALRMETEEHLRVIDQKSVTIKRLETSESELKRQLAETSVQQSELQETLSSLRSALETQGTGAGSQESRLREQLKLSHECIKTLRSGTAQRQGDGRQIESQHDADLSCELLSISNDEGRAGRNFDEILAENERILGADTPENSTEIPSVGPAGESVGSDTFARQLQMAEGLARVRRECTDLRTERNALAEQVQSLVDECERGKAEILELRTAVEGAQSGPEVARKLAAISLEKDQAERRFAEASEKLSQCTQTLAAATAARDAAVRTAQTLQGEVESARSGGGKVEEELRRLRAEYATVEQTNVSLKEKLVALTEQCANQQRELKNVSKGQTDSSEQITALQKQLGTAEEAARVTKISMERLKEDNEKQVALDKKIIKDLQIESRVKVAALEQSVVTLQSQLTESQREVSKLSTSLTRAEQEIQSLLKQQHQSEDGDGDDDAVLVGRVGGGAGGVGAEGAIVELLDTDMRKALSAVERLLEAIALHSTTLDQCLLQLQKPNEDDGVEGVTQFQRRVVQFVKVCDIASAQMDEIALERDIAGLGGDEAGFDQQHVTVSCVFGWVRRRFAVCLGTAREEGRYTPLGHV